MNTNESGNMVMPVAPMNNYGNGGFGGYGDGMFWIIILFLFAWGGNWGGNWGGGSNGTTTVVNDVQRGFDQTAVMGGISNIQNTLADAEVSRCNNMANLSNQLNSIAMAQQNCCCENRAATADLKYTVATESAATRANDQANTQVIMDKLCQLELDGVKQNYENRIAGMQNQIDTLSNQLNTANTQAFVGANVSRVLTDNAAQTALLRDVIAPTPVPAFPASNMYGYWNQGCGCNNGYGCGCGCGA